MKAWTPDEDARLLELYRLGRSTTRSSDRYRVMQWTAEHYSSSNPDTTHTSAYRRLDRLLELGVEAAQNLTIPQEAQTMQTNPTPRYTFAAIRTLDAGETPSSYRNEPGEFSGPYSADTVEEILDEVAHDTGRAELGSQRAQWWERGDVLWVAPIWEIAD